MVDFGNIAFLPPLMVTVVANGNIAILPMYKELDS